MLDSTPILEIRAKLFAGLPPQLYKSALRGRSTMIFAVRLGRYTNGLALLTVANLTACATLPGTAPLGPVRTLAVSPQVDVKSPRISNPLILMGLVGVVVGEIVADSEEKRLGSSLAAGPRSLADVLREEFIMQVSKSGRFELIDPEKADAVANLAITEISLGKDFSDDRMRPIVSIQLTISDIAGRLLWRGIARVSNADKRTPMYHGKVYLEEPTIAFDAYSIAIRTAVSDLVKHLAQPPTA